MLWVQPDLSRFNDCQRYFFLKCRPLSDYQILDAKTKYIAAAERVCRPGLLFGFVKNDASI